MVPPWYQCDTWRVRCFSQQHGRHAAVVARHTTTLHVILLRGHVRAGPSHFGVEQYPSENTKETKGDAKANKSGYVTPESSHVDYVYIRKKKQSVALLLSHNPEHDIEHSNIQSLWVLRDDIDHFTAGERTILNLHQSMACFHHECDESCHVNTSMQSAESG